MLVTPAAQAAGVETTVEEFRGAPRKRAGELAMLFPHGTVTIQPNAGHHPWLDDPEFFVSSVATFLAGDWRRQATGSVEHLPAVTAMAEETRPRPWSVALVLVWIGVWVGGLDVVANTVGLFTMVWVWRDHIDDYELALLVVVVPAAVAVAALIGTLSLLRRARDRSRSGRIGLAVLMFCFVPGAAVNFAVTELAYLVWAVTDWASQGGNQIPDWTPPLLVGSLVVDGVLLSLALAAGILLVLPVCARHTTRP